MRYIITIMNIFAIVFEIIAITMMIKTLNCRKEIARIYKNCCEYDEKVNKLEYTKAKGYKYDLIRKATDNNRSYNEAIKVIDNNLNVLLAASFFTLFVIIIIN